MDQPRTIVFTQDPPSPGTDVAVRVAMATVAGVAGLAGGLYLLALPSYTLYSVSRRGGMTETHLDGLAADGVAMAVLLVGLGVAIHFATPILGTVRRSAARNGAAAAFLLGIVCFLASLGVVTQRAIAPRVSHPAETSPAAPVPPTNTFRAYVPDGKGGFRPSWQESGN